MMGSICDFNPSLRKYQEFLLFFFLKILTARTYEFSRSYIFNPRNLFPRSPLPYTVTIFFYNALAYEYVGNVRFIIISRRVKCFFFFSLSLLSIVTIFLKKTIIIIYTIFFFSRHFRFTRVRAMRS